MGILFYLNKSLEKPKYKMEGDSQNQTIKLEQTEEVAKTTEDIDAPESSAQDNVQVPSSEGSTNSSEGFVKLEDLEDNTPTQENVQPIESSEVEGTHQDFTKLTPSNEAAPNPIVEEEVAEEVPEEPQVVEEIPIQAANDEPCEDQPCAMSQLMTVLSATNLNNIIPTNKKEVMELLYWRDIISSLVALSVLLLTMYALRTSSFLLVLSYVFISALTVTNLLKAYKWVTGLVTGKQQSNPLQQFLDMNVELKEECVEEYTKLAVKHVNCFVTTTRDLIFMKNMICSAKFFLVCWVMGYVGAAFNFLTLLTFATIGAFAVPLVYEKNQVLIDDVCGKVKNCLSDGVAYVRNLVPGLKPKTE